MKRGLSSAYILIGIAVIAIAFLLVDELDTPTGLQTINQPPYIVANSIQTDGRSATVDLLTLFMDADGDTLTFSTDDTAATIMGTTIAFTAPQEALDNYTITVTVSDGTHTLAKPITFEGIVPQEVALPESLPEAAPQDQPNITSETQQEDAQETPSPPLEPLLPDSAILITQSDDNSTTISVDAPLRGTVLIPAQPSLPSSSNVDSSEPSRGISACVDLDTIPGLIAWWPGDGNASDISGNGFHGTENNVTYTGGIVGSQFRFGGARSDNVSVPHDPDLNPVDMTVMGWVELDASAIVRGRPYQKTDSAEDGYFTQLGASVGLFSVLYGNGSGGFSKSLAGIGGTFNNRNFTFGQGGPVLALGDPVFFATTLDGTSDAVLDFFGTPGGIPWDTTADINDYSPAATPFVIGSQIDGNMDEIMIFGRALSLSEIDAIYEAETGGTGGCRKVCGDDIFEPNTEECDDGNAASGDGCSSTCTIEPGYCFNINASGTYTLTQDVNGTFDWDADGACIAISDTDVTLDCNGYVINGTGSGTAIDILSDSTTIQNCVFDQWETAIEIDGPVSNSLLSNNITNTITGTYLANTNGNTVFNNNIASTSAEGIYLLSATDNDIIHNNVATSDSGVYLDTGADNNNVLYNNFSDNNFGFFVFEADSNYIAFNNITTTGTSNFGDGATSCPLFYSWNGTGYSFVGDIFGRGILATPIGNGTYKKPVPFDWMKIEGSQLQEVNGTYVVQVAEEQDEMAFVDELVLTTIDHSPDVDVYPSGLVKPEVDTLYTVSKNLTPILSCKDNHGNDCLVEISTKDEIYSGPGDGQNHYVELDLGELSGASTIKLVLWSYLGFDGYAKISNGSNITYAPKSNATYTRFVRVRNESDEWKEVHNLGTLNIADGFPRMYIIDLTGQFPTANHTIQLQIGSSPFDYIAVDTTDQEALTVANITPSLADLHYRGYSIRGEGQVEYPDYHNVTNITNYHNPSGNFTRYGDVLPLVVGTDDKYVIMHHGDEITVTFPAASAPAPGMVRDYLLYSVGYFKQPPAVNPGGVNGTTVEPLPFFNMSTYPYAENESYPGGIDHQTYLATYNNRSYDGIVQNLGGGALPNSFDNMVANNAINGSAGAIGLWLTGETDTTIVNNTIVEVTDGILVQDSTGTRVIANNISNIDRAIVLEAAIDGTFIDNNLTITSDTAVNVLDGSHGNNFTNTTVIESATGITIRDSDDGIYINTRLQNMTLEGITFENSGSNLFTNVNLSTNETWFIIDVNSADNEVTGIRFEDFTAGSMTLFPTFTLQSDVTVNQDNLHIFNNSAFINTTDFPEFNVSGRVALAGITLTDPRPQVDFEDDGTFSNCAGVICFFESYSGGVYTFNVSHFTTYQVTNTTVSNTSPSVTTPDIAPDPASGNDVLNASCVFTDDDLDLGGLTFNWTVDGVLVNSTLYGVSNGTNVTDYLYAGSYGLNDNVSVFCHVIDGQGASSAVTNDSIIIAFNAHPTIAQVILNSTDGSGFANDVASSSENLTAFILNVFDAENDTVQNITDWRVNGTSIAVLNLPFETNSSNLSTGAIRDYSTFLNNGTLGNGTAGSDPTWTSSQVGGGYAFDGSSDVITLNNTLYNPFPATGFTYEFWISPLNSIETRRTIIANNHAASGGWWNGISLFTAGNIELELQNVSTGLSFSWVSTSTVTSGVHHVVVSYQNTGTLATDGKIYLDGVLQSVTPSGAGYTSAFVPGYISSFGFTLGSNIANELNGGYFNGTISEARLYGRVLSAQQIYQLYLDGNNSNHSLTWVSNETTPGEIWSVAVTPNDGRNASDGTTVLSNNVTISANDEPQIAQVILNSTDGSGEFGTAGSDENLTVLIINATDLNNDAIQNITDWRLNGDSIALLTLPFETNSSNVSLGEIRDYSSADRDVTLGDGVVGQAPVWNSSGQVGGAYTFDGVNDVIIADLDAPAASYTLSAWVRFTGATLTGYRTLLEFGNDAPFFGILNDELTLDGAVIGGNIPTNQWIFVAYTFDGTQSVLYINDTVVDNQTATPNGGGIELGIGFHAGDPYWPGLIDEVNIYDRALSQAQIAALFQDGLAGLHPSSMVSSELAASDVWTVAATPNDQRPNTDGNTVVSNSVTISDGCPLLISTNTTLSENLTCPETAIQLLANDLTLDCMGNTVTWGTTGQNGHDGVVGNELSNVTVRNCIVTHGATTGNGTTGIAFQRSNETLVVNNTVFNTAEENANGINLALGTNNSRAHNNTVTINSSSVFSFGIALSDLNNVTISNNSATAHTFGPGNYSWAIVVIGFIENTFAENITIENNTASTDAANGIGIYLERTMNTTVRENTVNSTGIETKGIQAAASQSTLVRNNRVSLFPQDGFSQSIAVVGSNDTIVENNSAALNLTLFGSVSIMVSESSLDTLITNNDVALGGTFGDAAIYLIGSDRTNVTYNRVLSSTPGDDAVGIWLDPLSSNSLVSSNNVTAESASNARAIYVTGTDNVTIIQNNATANTTNVSQALVIEVAFDTVAENNTLAAQSGTFTADGIWVLSSNGTRIANNNITFDATGVYLSQSLNTTFEDQFIPFPPLSPRGSLHIEENNGIISYVEDINASIESLMSDIVNISVNLTRVNTTTPEGNQFNASANISLFGLSFIDPQVFVDRQDDGSFAPCNAPECNETSYDGENLTFNVSHFTSYAASENNCPLQVNTSTTLTQNITCPSIAINITAHNIELDCAGYTVTYHTDGVIDVGFLEPGIIVDDKNNITIRNCILVNGNTAGDTAPGIGYSGNDSIIRNNTVLTNGTGGFGISVTNTVSTTGFGGLNVTVQNNTVSSNGTSTIGFIAINSENISILDNAIVLTGSDSHTGIRYDSATNGTARNNTISINTTGCCNNGFFIDIEGGITFENNSVSITSTGGDNGIVLQETSRNAVANNILALRGSSIPTTTGIDIRESPHNTVTNNAVTISGDAGDHRGITVDGDVPNNNTYTNNTVNVHGNLSFGLRLGFTAGENTRNDNFHSTTITATGNGTQGVYFQGDGYNLTNTIINGSPTWIYSEAGNDANNITNTTFMTTNGNINIPANISLLDFHNISQQQLNITLNNSYLNSTNLTLFNQSAIVTLNGLGFADPYLVVDFEDDGTFVTCVIGSQCDEISYAGGTFVFNVSSFTSYASAETVVVGTINITFDKIDAPDPVARGSSLSYQIQINNTGNGTAENLTVVEGYPAGVSFVVASPTPVGNDTFNLGNLSGGAVTTINITVTVGSNLANGTILNNTINLSFQNSSGDTITANDSELTTVLGSPVLVSIKSDTPDPVIRGQTLNYSILINNTGDDTAFNVTLSETYPAGVSFVTAQPTPTGNNTFAIGTLSPNQTFLVNITVTVGSNVVNATLLNNTVNASWRNVSGQQGTVADSELTTVLGFAALTVVKTDTPDPVTNGSVLSYQITVTNTGDEIAYNVTAVDGYPANVSLGATSPAPVAGNDTFSLGNLTPGQSTTINITVTVSANMTSGVLNNSVNVTFTNASGASGTLNAFQLSTVTIPGVAAAPSGGGSSGFRNANLSRIAVPQTTVVTWPQAAPEPTRPAQAVALVSQANDSQEQEEGIDAQEELQPIAGQATLPGDTPGPDARPILLAGLLLVILALSVIVVLRQHSRASPPHAESLPIARLARNRQNSRARPAAAPKPATTIQQRELSEIDSHIKEVNALLRAINRKAKK